MGGRKLTTLKKNKEFGFAYRRGSAVSARDFTLVYAKSRYGGVRAGFSVSKKVGNSVVRNRARRRLKEAFRLFLPELKGNFCIVFVARDGAATSEFKRMADAMRSALKKAGIVA